MKKELSIAIVKGQVADYAKGVAGNNDLTQRELVQVLKDLVVLFESN